MKQYEFTARTESEAIEQGLQELGVSIADVEVQVVEEGSKGLFGLFGSRPVKVRLTLKDAEEDPLADLLEEKPAKKTEKKAEKAEKKVEKKAEKAEEKTEKKAEKKPEKKAEKAEKKAEPKAEEQTEEAPKAPKQEIRPMEKPEVTMIAAEELTEDSPAGIAHAFLMELTKLMGVDVTILGILIGRRGETLDAVQYLTSLKVNRGREGYTRVTLDTENYRAKREDTLIRLANRMANRALRTGRKVSLEPMNPYERRIIHYALQQTDGVDTHSEGEEPNRHVVITQKK